MFSILNPKGYSNLAILICHLFIGGEFQVANVLFDPKVLNFQLINEINSQCSSEINWMMIDITQHERLEWNYKEANDHIIQLIFLDPNQLPAQKKMLEKHLAYYRLFIFDSRAEETFEMSTKWNLNTSTNSLALFHKYEENYCKAFLMHDDHTLFDQSFHVKMDMENVTPEQTFDIIFSKRENKRILAVSYATFHCNSTGRPTVDAIFSRFLANFYFMQMNLIIIEMILWCPGQPDFEKRFRHVKQPIYNELTLDIIQD